MSSEIACVCQQNVCWFFAFQIVCEGGLDSLLFEAISEKTKTAMKYVMNILHGTILQFYNIQRYVSPRRFVEKNLKMDCNTTQLQRPY